MGKKLTIGSCKKIALLREGKCISEDYVNAKINLIWECKYGHQWSANLDSIKYLKNWCPYCSKKIPKTLNDYYNLAKLNNGECLITETPKNTNIKVLWKCKNNYTFESAYHNISSNHRWCKRCNFSKRQELLGNILKSIFPNYTIKYCFKDFNWLNTFKGYRQELDIWIPELKLAIEYDGEQHFKPVRFGGISQEKAIERFINTNKLDKIKEEKVKQHPGDISYFIRFSYKDSLTEDNIKNILNKNGII